MTRIVNNRFNRDFAVDLRGLAPLIATVTLPTMVGMTTNAALRGGFSADA